jgi:hypothetical protein
MTCLWAFVAQLSHNSIVQFRGRGEGCYPERKLASTCVILLYKGQIGSSQSSETHESAINRKYLCVPVTVDIMHISRCVLHCTLLCKCNSTLFSVNWHCNSIVLSYCAFFLVLLCTCDRTFTFTLYFQCTFTVYFCCTCTVLHCSVTALSLPFHCTFNAPLCISLYVYIERRDN